MPFDSGRVTFARFRVIGDAPAMPDEKTFEQLKENRFREVEIGAPDEIEAGFITGQHILDSDFNYDKCGYGNRLLFALRIDTHKVPSDLKKAYQKINEQASAADNPSGFATRAQKREAKEEAQRLLHDDLAAGKFRKSKSIPLLWDMSTQTLFVGGSSDAIQEELRKLFRQAFSCDLHTLSSGAQAGEILKNKGRARDYEDILPTPFTQAPAEANAEAADNTLPIVPWVAKAVDLKDFVGNEFLMWLWFNTETQDGKIPSSSNEIYASIDKALDMDCAWEVGGKQTLRGNGPARLQEAATALKAGKWPRKLGLLLSDGEHGFELALQGDQLIVGACKLPDIEDAESPREITDARILLTIRLAEVLDDIYADFIDHRTTEAWTTSRDKIKAWISDKK